MTVRLLCSILGVVLLANSCKKETAIASELKIGQQIGQSAFHILAAWTPAEEFAFGRWETFASKQISVDAIDTLFTDGDGVAYVLDFGTGFVCTDGIKRTGKCTVEISQQQFPAAGSLTWKCDAQDKFAFLNDTDRIGITGQMHLTLDSTGQFQMTFNLHHSNGRDSLHLFTEDKRVNIVYEQPIQKTRKSATWEGAWSCTGNTNLSSSIEGKLHNSATCYSLWNSGRLEIVDVNKSVYQLNVDPFSTATCDLEFTVNKGKGLNSMEMVFKAW